MMRSGARLASTFLLLFFVQIARADTSKPATPPRAAPSKVWIDDGDSFHLDSLPAISADGTRVALAERCDDLRGRFCLAIAFLSADGKARGRVEIAGNEEEYRHGKSALPSVLRSKIEARLARVNKLFTDGNFTTMSPLDLPFSAFDFDLINMNVSGVAIHYDADRSLSLRRPGNPVVKLLLPRAGLCTEPWISSMFLHEKTHTLVVGIEYHPRGSCSAAPPTAWKVGRFP